MKTTALHTFEEVITNGIKVDGEAEPKKISFIFIPKIQRSYAQGRNSELDVRTEFLKEIFATLTSDRDTPLELSFLFGSRQCMNNGEEGFELLDGQQRTTTLFLLYWYVNCRESADMPEFLTCFTYETRDTSTHFLKKISTTKYDFTNEKPSTVLKSNKWFTDDYNCDATICSMLNMLDDIHIRYNETGRDDLLDKLSRLKFYVLLLEKFDMNDELYIKMNSRGLALTPFENFKASIVKYMKSDDRNGIYGDDNTADGKLPFWLQFITDIDSKWIDIIWKFNDNTIDEPIDIDDNDIGNKYLRFFNRYFFTKSALLEGLKDKKISSLTSFFYNDAESNEMDHRLKGWEYYEELFKHLTEKQTVVHNPIFGPIERIFNVFLDNYEEICQSINNYNYGGSKGFDVLSEKDNFKLSHRAVFAAVTEFIEAIPDEYKFTDDVVQENFKRMLRVVHNILENTLIESSVALVGVLKAIDEIIHLEGATCDNFYKSLANAEKLFSNNSQLDEEKKKTEMMFDADGNYDSSWEEAFIEAENHDFFKGSIRFFLSNNEMSSEEFREHFKEIGDLFDKNGIADKFRKNKQHILIRAILSCLNEWEPSGSMGMSNRYVTENAESQKYLKIILLGSENVRNMFCNYFENKKHNHITIDDYLEKFVENAKVKDDENKSFVMLYERLVKDKYSTEIFEWIAEQEKDKRRFRIQNNRSYIVAIPGTWHDRIVLDTERHLIIPELINDMGFDFSDNNQKESMNKMNDSYGWQIAIEKEIGDYILKLVFNEYKKLVFYVKGNDNSIILNLFSLDNNMISNEGVEIDSVDYRYKKDIADIKNKIEEIEKKLV